MMFFILASVFLLLSFAHAVPFPQSGGGGTIIHAKYNDKFKPDPHARIRAIRKWQGRMGGQVISSMKGQSP